MCGRGFGRAYLLKEINMFIRCAFFEGRVKPGCEEAFATFVKDRLVPLWTKFPGAEEVRVLRQIEADVDEPHYAMVLSIGYPNRAAIDEALKSNVRQQSRLETVELVKMYEGRIFHTVFEVPHAAQLLPENRAL
jgi:antibiotic biosynthesis monooxygenase (ABM) superfamily enzyme